MEQIVIIEGSPKAEKLARKAGYVRVWMKRCVDGGLWGGVVVAWPDRPSETLRRVRRVSAEKELMDEAVQAAAHRGMKAVIVERRGTCSIKTKRQDVVVR